jgi:hypothetical protein
MKPLVTAAGCSCSGDLIAGGATETSGGRIAGRGGVTLGGCELRLKRGKSGAAASYCCFLSSWALVVFDYTVFDCLERIREGNRYSLLHRSCSYDH